MYQNLRVHAQELLYLSIVASNFQIGTFSFPIGFYLFEVRVFNSARQNNG